VYGLPKRSKDQQKSTLSTLRHHRASKWPPGAPTSPGRSKRTPPGPQKGGPQRRKQEEKRKKNDERENKDKSDKRDKREKMDKNMN
jgi:hypothetical protein